MLQNNLSKSTSPYLLQHQDNAVHWQEWSDEVLELAKKENKCLLISIGYSACHWCHVMAHESFEDEEVARIMNKHFINIKIDREERPDIDQIYMEAAQLLTGRGGWPLNAFALPDGKPFYAGTYFPKDNWMKVLNNIAEVYKDQPKTIIETANRLTEGIKNQDIFNNDLNGSSFSEKEIQESYQNWYKHIDFNDGGMDKAPKFPMPCVWQSLLEYYVVYKDEKALEAVTTSLNKMYTGGIYDWVGGGFSRYSVDGIWFAPHFEKMLYDNAQLLALYADAYKITKRQDYKNCIDQTINFLNSELKHDTLGYYSALDADSEGVEGLFYTWTLDDLKVLLTENELQLVTSFFNLKSNGNWENNLNILAQVKSISDLAEEFKMSKSEAKSRLEAIKTKLFKARQVRIRPGLDNKVITAQNAMMVKGLTKAFQASQNHEYKTMAIQLMDQLIEYTINYDSSVLRLYNKPHLNGFLDDYAFLIEALIYSYEISFNKTYLDVAEKLLYFTQDNFFDQEKNLFYYTSISNKLIARKIEFSDNVIPSSNGVMSMNLWRLGHLLSNSSYTNQSKKMLETVRPLFGEFKMYFAVWHQLEIAIQKGQIEIAITGPNAIKNAAILQQHYLPYSSLCGGNQENLPQLQGKMQHEKDQIFICQNQTCSQPFSTIEQSINFINKK